jgi:uncharacterized protein (TIGR00297 family)
MTDLARALLIGTALSGAVAAAAWLRGSLSGSGAWAAVVIGGLIFGCGGWVWGAVLITFFVLSSSLSAIGREAKAPIERRYAKGSRRDAGQVLANGGVAAAMAVLSLGWQDGVVLAGFVGAMATVTADTWATELGVLHRAPPRLITTGRPVPAGTSGAVSMVGTSATLLGATIIGVAALAFFRLDANLGAARAAGVDPGWWLIPVAAGGGLVGSLLDSLLGATLQVVYRDSGSGVETERSTDANGRQNTTVRGLPWFGNDQVNAVSSAGGAVAAALLYSVLRG